MAPMGTANEPRNAASVQDQPVIGPSRDRGPSVLPARSQRDPAQEITQVSSRGSDAATSGILFNNHGIHISLSREALPCSIPRIGKIIARWQSSVQSRRRKRAEFFFSRTREVGRANTRRVECIYR